MNNPLLGTPTHETPQTSSAKKAAGCGSTAVFILSSIWIIAVSAIILFLSWSLEQTIAEGSLALPDIRWMFQLFYGIGLLIPFTVLAVIIPSARHKSIYTTLALAAGASLLFTPARRTEIYASQLTALLQIGGMLVFLLGLFAFTKLRPGFLLPGWKNQGGGHGLAWMAVGICLLPWVLWGALGSPLDTLLGLLQGLLFGLVAAMVLRAGIFRYYLLVDEEDKDRTFWLDGWVSFLSILILVTGMAQNGTQWLLAMLLPIAGLGAVVLARYSRQLGVTFNGPAVTVFLGLLTAWPLTWFDPDELFLIISQSSGEVMYWAGRAAQTCLAILVAIIILLIIFRKRLEAIGRTSWPVRGVTVLIWGVMMAIYFLAGQVGFFGEQQFIILKNQADLTDVSTIEDATARREAVYKTLVNTANSSQADLRAELTRLGIKFTPYYLVNGIAIQAEPIIGTWLESRLDVDRVIANPRLRPLARELVSPKGDAQKPEQPEWNLTFIQAEKVWRELGVTGKGVVVGQSDSGAAWDHPELKDSYRGRDGSNDYNWLDPWYQQAKPYDLNGHGTHTLGTVLGNSVGVAPDADWIGCVNLARNLGDVGYYLDCMQFMLAPYPQTGDPFADGKPELGANVLNNSWGCPAMEGCDSKVFTPAVRALRTAGIFVAAAAGNNGYGQCGTIKDPLAIYAEVFTVGAVDSNGELTDFSSLGPVVVDGSGRIKPDIVAPGQDVLSAFPGGSYAVLSGTSMASPHLAGAVALIWSANPDLIGRIDETEMILEQSARPFTGTLPSCVSVNSIPNTAAGYGYLDVYKAVQLALQKH